MDLLNRDRFLSTREVIYTGTRGRLKPHLSFLLFLPLRTEAGEKTLKLEDLPGPVFERVEVNTQGAKITKIVRGR